MVITISHYFNTAGKHFQEFLDIPVAFLQDLLNSDELNLHHEEDLLDAYYPCHTHVLPLDDSVMLGLLWCVRAGVCEQASLDKARKRLPALAQRPVSRHATDDAVERGPCRFPSGEQPLLLDSSR